MKRFAFAVPGDLATPTGGYAYDRRMIAELGDLGSKATNSTIPLTNNRLRNMTPKLRKLGNASVSVF